MKIRQLLRGKNEKAQTRLDELFGSIGDNPKILWYPSAGNDYRDILELTDISIDENIKGNINISKDYGITNLPDIFIHTDYSTKIVELREGEIFNDGKNIGNGRKIL